MKKIIAMIAALSMVMAFASCGGDTTTDVSSTDASVNSVVSTPSTIVIPSVPTPSEPTPEENNNLAAGETATLVDMNTGIEEGAEGYTAYYSGDYGLHLPELGVDGDKTTGWQIAIDSVKDDTYTEGAEIPEGWYVAGDGGLYQQQTFEDGALWFGVTFSELTKVDLVNYYWESGSVPMTVEEGGIRYEITTDGETWTAVDVAATRDDSVAEYYIDTLDFEDVEIMGVRAVILKATTKYAPKVYELEVYAPEEVEEPVEDAESTDETVAE